MRPLGPLSPESLPSPIKTRTSQAKKDTEVLDLSLSLFAGSTSIFQNLKFSAPKVKPVGWLLYHQLARHLAQSHSELLGSRKGKEGGRMA